MSKSAVTKQLLASWRWAGFMESAAAALHLNLAAFLPEDSSCVQKPLYCPVCGCSFPELTAQDLDLALKHSGAANNPAGFATAAGHKAAVIRLHDGLRLVVRQCALCPAEGTLPLEVRAGMVQKLLSSFQLCLSKGMEGDLRATLLPVLRRMNYIVLSFFQGDGAAVARALDLILSSLVVLLDARGYWLSYEAGDRQVLLVKGDEATVSCCLRSGCDAREELEIPSSKVRGRLGVVEPADYGQAAELLPNLAQECSIVYEIEHIFELVNTRLPQVLDAIGSAVLLVNRDGIIVYANSCAEKLLQYPTLGLIDIPAAGLEAPWTPFLRERTERRAWGRMDPLGQGDDGPWLDWQVLPLRAGEGASGWLVLAEDRSDHHRWQEAARQAERLAVTTTMVGALAHEIRNPLTAARGLLQLIARKRDPEKVRGYVDLIMRELDRVNRLLNEFLLLGRPAELDPEPLDLQAFLQELRPLLEGEAVLSGVELQMNLEPVPPVAADPGQLTQVVLNLVRNAVEAAGQRGLVRLILRGAGDNVTFSVHDNGPGLTPEVRERLFQPFFTTKERGTGLGLPVVQAIVHNHGGRISCAAAPEGGAAFVVELPALRMEGKVSAVDVLIAVTDEIIRYPSEQAFRAANLRVVSAACPGDLPGLAERYAPAVLLLDRQVLEHYGLERLQKIWPEAKVLVVGESTLTVERDVCGFIPTPLEYTSLVARVQLLLEDACNKVDQR